jgi:hypothetical protein
VEAYEGGRGIPRKHTDRHAAPFGEAEWPAWPYGYVRESEFSAQISKHTFDEIALSFGGAACGDQEIRAASCPSEHRRQGGMIICSDAFVARFSTGREHERGKRYGIAVPHLAARRRGRDINKFVASANDCHSRTSKYAHRGFAGESKKRQLPRVQDLASGNEFIAVVEIFAGRENRIAWGHRRENADRRAMSLDAFVRNHGIGAAWNWRSGCDGQRGSERES